MTCAVITAMKLSEKKFTKICRSLNQGQFSARIFEIKLKTGFLRTNTKFFGKDILRKFRYSLSEARRNLLIDKTYFVCGLHQSYGTSHIELALDVEFVCLNRFFTHGKPIRDVFQTDFVANHFQYFAFAL